MIRSKRILALAVAASGLTLGAAQAGTPPAVCAAHVKLGVLPVWARTGFSEARPKSRYVLGTSGRILAIPFGYPLVTPPYVNRNNKILWVSRLPPKPLSDLLIRAQRMEGSVSVGAPVSRFVPEGPGPSIIDLPAPGCWRMTLRWSGRVDTLDLRYLPRR
jgi:hypothetical protein